MRPSGRALAMGAALAAATALAPAYGDPPADLPNPVLPRAVVVVQRAARTADYAEFEIRWENLNGDSDAVVDFGDGSHPHRHGVRGGLCGAYSPNDTDREYVKHAYRRPGTYTVTATWYPRSCEVDVEPYTGTAQVTITPGRSPSNGPRRPVLDLQVDPAGGRRARFFFDYEDYDGYLTRLAFSFGDGSRDRVFTFPLSRCKDPKTHWPRSARTNGDPRPWEAFEYAYRRSGQYPVSVTMTTTGCDGRDKQVAVTTTVARV